MRVVFPAPLGPRIPYVSPGWTAKDRLSSATNSPNFFVSFSASMAGVRSAPARFDDEGLARDDRRVLGSEADGESLEVAALEAKVLPRGELRAGFHGHDLR